MPSEASDVPSLTREGERFNDEQGSSLWLIIFLNIYFYEALKRHSAGKLIPVNFPSCATDNVNAFICSICILIIIITAWGCIHIVMICIATKFRPLALTPSSRGIAQAVSRWLPIAEARVRSQVRSCGICGRQSGTEAGFLRVLRFPLPILIPLTAP
jgi:hypothetical protein